MSRNQVKDSITHFLQCSFFIYRYNFLRHISFPSSNCKLGAGLFISITLRANLAALHAFKYKIIIFLNRGAIKSTRTVTKQQIFYYVS